MTIGKMQLIVESKPSRKLQKMRCTDFASFSHFSFRSSDDREPLKELANCNVTFGQMADGVCLTDWQLAQRVLWVALFVCVRVYVCVCGCPMNPESRILLGLSKCASTALNLHRWCCLFLVHSFLSSCLPSFSHSHTSSAPCYLFFFWLS